MLTGPQHQLWSPGTVWELKKILVVLQTSHILAGHPEVDFPKGNIKSNTLQLTPPKTLLNVFSEWLSKVRPIKTLTATLYSPCTHRVFLLPVIRCIPPLFTPASGSMSCDKGNIYGSTCTFNCAHSHELKGSASRTCEATNSSVLGSWTGNQTECEGILNISTMYRPHTKYIPPTYRPRYWPHTDQFNLFTIAMNHIYCFNIYTWNTHCVSSGHKMGVYKLLSEILFFWNRQFHNGRLGPVLGKSESIFVIIHSTLGSRWWNSVKRCEWQSIISNNFSYSSVIWWLYWQFIGSKGTVLELRSACDR